MCLACREQQTSNQVCGVVQPQWSEVAGAQHRDNEMKGVKYSKPLIIMEHDLILQHRIYVEHLMDLMDLSPI